MSIRMICRAGALLALTLAIAGCAIGNKYDYNATSVTIGVESEKSVSVGVVDQRSYVLSGRKAPNFVGLQRGGWGNPFDVATVSGRGLAEELTGVLKRGLAARGVAAEALVAPHGTKIDAIIDRFARQGTDRLLLVTMREWKTDAMLRLTLHWGLDATVFDAAGNKLASHSIDGVAPIAGAGLQDANSNAASQQASQKFNELLNDPDILAALE